MNNCRAYLTPLIWVGLLCSCANDGPPDCKRIRNGNFYYYTKEKRQRVDIYRKDTVQIETSLENGSPLMKSKVIWKGDCQFDMFVNGLSETKLSGTDSLLAVTPAQVQIIYVGKKYYICTAKLNLLSKEIALRDTLYYFTK